MNNNTVLFILGLLTVFFIVGFIFKVMIVLGPGIIVFLTILYFFQQKREVLKGKFSFENLKDVYRKKQKDKTYKKLKIVWAEVLKKYHPHMKCPQCENEITIFNINIEGRCLNCNKRLV